MLRAVLNKSSVLPEHLDMSFNRPDNGQKGAGCLQYMAKKAPAKRKTEKAHYRHDIEREAGGSCRQRMSKITDQTQVTLPESFKYKNQAEPQSFQPDKKLNEAKPFH